MQRHLTVTASGPSGTGSRTAACSVRPRFGCNLAQYAAVSPVLGGITWVKSFAAGGWPNGVPSAWPGNSAYPVPAGAAVLACIAPNPAMAAAGQLDGPLSAFFELAPPGSMVTAWQEADDGSNGYWRQPGASASQLTDMHGRLYQVKQQANPGVLYVEDFGCAPAIAGKDISGYVASGLDGYVLDGYQHKAAQTAADVFGAIWPMITSVVPGTRPGIAETNTTATTDGSWFTSCRDWLLARRGTGLALWTGPGTNYTYAVPPEPGNLAALQAISQEFLA